MLLLLPQLPQDPASGAARTLTSICEALVSQGFAVRALGTSLSEQAAPFDAPALLAARGIAVQRRPGVLHYQHRGIRFQAVEAPPGLTLAQWGQTDWPAFDRIFEQELVRHRPDLVFTYGLMPGDLRRHATALRSGARIVFGLCNEGYLACRSWSHLALVITPSQYLSERYWAACRLPSHPLPVPIDPTEVLAADREPIFATLVNPSEEKGVGFFARLAEALSLQRPDLPLLVVEARGHAGTLVQAGLAAGFDLRRHANIMVSGPVPQPRDIYAPTRLLLVPSLREAGARVVAEALTNGIPPLVSDRGGLPEMCCGAGRVLPLPAGAASPVQPWIEAIVPLMDDDALYAQASAQARAAAAAYSPAQLAPRAAALFRTAMAAPL